MTPNSHDDTSSANTFLAACRVVTDDALNMMVDDDDFSSLNDAGVSRHLVGDTAGAMDFYERALRARLESSSSSSKTTHPCKKDLPSRTRHDVAATPRPEADADGDSSLIGMGRFVDPLELGEVGIDGNGDGDDAATAVMLFNTSLIKMSRSHFDVARDLLQLALPGLDEHQRRSSSSSTSTPFFPRLRLMLLTNLGMAHYRLGEYDAAAARFEEASAVPGLLLRDAERGRGRTHTPSSSSSPASVKCALRCLVYSLLNAARASDAAAGIRATGRSNEALAMVREACGMCETITACFHDHHDDADVEDYDDEAELAAGAAYVEAVIHHRRGEREAAEECYRRCLELSSTSMSTSSDHGTSLSSSSAPLRRAAALHGLGRALFERRRLLDAAAPLRRAWSLRARHLGEEHLESIDALYVLGRTLHDAEELSDAADAYERAHLLQRSALGPGHVDTLRTLCNVGRVQRSCGRGADALATCREAIAAGTATLGPGHPFVLDMLVMRGMVLHEMGRRGEASEAFADAIRVADGESGAKVQDLLADCLKGGPCIGGEESGAAAA